ncbi:MAG: YdiU family protein [Polyangia bacterium]
MSVSFGFQHSYARELVGFYARVQPAKAPAPQLLLLNTALAELLGLDLRALDEQALAKVFSGSVLPADAEPIALAYAGHQFGNFVPQLGDGRAILLGEIVGRDGVRRDVQLKGAGQTPFSRRGDGRAALGPVLREYLVSEAMHALGVPSTRALAAVATGEPVYRETVLPGAVFTRVARSHIRVGTFQFFARRADVQGLQKLADYVIARHDPELARAPNPYLALLDAVMQRQAALVARWMMVGFVHGVMNTDNMALSGETIDFGPCAFLDVYDPRTVFSSIDQGGRYAYKNQAPIAMWNLARLAETLLPLIAEDAERAVAIATEHLERFEALFGEQYLSGLRAKLGLAQAEPDDEALAQELLEQMYLSRADFTTTFRLLCEVAAGQDAAALRSRFSDPARFDAWCQRWRSRAALERTSPAEQAQAMRRANPAFIPRNHRVEHALQQAVQLGDLSAYNRLAKILARPYDDQPEHAEYAEPPPADFGPYRTFCGT